jgi:hypothetical protein
MGGRAGKPLSNMAMLELMRGMLPGSGYVPHGVRSTFRDWTAERTGYASEVAEMALAHAIESSLGRLPARRSLRKAASPHGRLGVILYFARLR